MPPLSVAPSLKEERNLYLRAFFPEKKVQTALPHDVFFTPFSRISSNPDQAVFHVVFLLFIFFANSHHLTSFSLVIRLFVRASRISEAQNCGVKGGRMTAAE